MSSSGSNSMLMAVDGLNKKKSAVRKKKFDEQSTSGFCPGCMGSAKDPTARVSRRTGRLMMTRRRIVVVVTTGEVCVRVEGFVKCRIVGGW